MGDHELNTPKGLSERVDELECRLKKLEDKHAEQVKAIMALVAVSLNEKGVFDDIIATLLDDLDPDVRAKIESIQEKTN